MASRFYCLVIIDYHGKRLIPNLLAVLDKILTELVNVDEPAPGLQGAKRISGVLVGIATPAQRSISLSLHLAGPGVPFNRLQRPRAQHESHAQQERGHGGFNVDVQRQRCGGGRCGMLR